MSRRTFAAVLCGCMASVCGCVSADAGRRQEDPAAEAVRARADTFLTLVVNKDYAEISSMVLPREARGLNVQDFVENNFRMRTGHFDIIAWDGLAIRVTPLKDTPGMLSTAPVSIRVLTTNEVKPIYVNLHWQKQAGRWYIDPYPRD